MHLLGRGIYTLKKYFVPLKTKIRFHRNDLTCTNYLWDCRVGFSLILKAIADSFPTHVHWGKFSSFFFLCSFVLFGCICDVCLNLRLIGKGKGTRRHDFKMNSQFYKPFFTFIYQTSPLKHKIGRTSKNLDCLNHAIADRFPQFHEASHFASSQLYSR